MSQEASKKDIGDLLETVDKFGKRLWVYADIVKGKWRQRRKVVSFILMAVYLGLPWLYWNGMPLIQLDLVGHRLLLFGAILDFSEIAVLLALLFSFAFAVIGFTSVAGRVWCGWGCPQTVFLDFLFRPIEKWIEGRPSERRKRDQSELTLDTIMRTSAKWMLYIIASFVISNTFVAYFSGSSKLLEFMTSSPMQHLGLFSVMLLVFSGFLFNFGWFREQMCTLVCPYGRLQSVLLDKNSYVVGYNVTRGEPRSKISAKVASKGGDCVDCNRCVQVCPTGIDIRNGIQLECINCAACIDACNIVMEKVNKAPNLIGYITENKSAGIKASNRRLIRPLVYFVISALFFSFFIKGSFYRKPFSIMELKSKSLSIVDDGTFVRNQVGFIIKNQTSETMQLKMESSIDTSIFSGQNPVTVPANQSTEIQIFVQVPKERFVNGIANTKLLFTSSDNSEEVNVAILSQGEKK